MNRLQKNIKLNYSLVPKNGQYVTIQPISNGALSLFPPGGVVGLPDQGDDLKVYPLALEDLRLAGRKKSSPGSWQ